MTRRTRNMTEISQKCIVKSGGVSRKVFLKEMGGIDSELLYKTMVGLVHQRRFIDY